MILNEIAGLMPHWAWHMLGGAAAGLLAIWLADKYVGWLTALIIGVVAGGLSQVAYELVSDCWHLLPDWWPSAASPSLDDVLAGLLGGLLVSIATALYWIWKDWRGLC